MERLRRGGGRGGKGGVKLALKISSGMLRQRLLLSKVGRIYLSWSWMPGGRWLMLGLVGISLWSSLTSSWSGCAGWRSIMMVVVVVPLNPRFGICGGGGGGLEKQCRVDIRVDVDFASLLWPPRSLHGFWCQAKGVAKLLLWMFWSDRIMSAFCVSLALFLALCIGCVVWLILDTMAFHTGNFSFFFSSGRSIGCSVKRL